MMRPYNFYALPYDAQMAIRRGETDAARGRRAAYRAQTLGERVAALEEALKPFAAMADKFGNLTVVEVCQSHPENPSPNIEPIPGACFIRARAALNDGGGNG